MIRPKIEFCRIPSRVSPAESFGKQNPEAEQTLSLGGFRRNGLPALPRTVGTSLAQSQGHQSTAARSD
jgi:FKBP-type peptidyl-prolyl cis-trans isomerase 2